MKLTLVIFITNAPEVVIKNFVHIMVLHVL